ncbi:hypothetical protein [Pseudonocardia broussonetiae]|uniref:Uncharacterized protein n=1 Tax=Pseudonocardia broussonetiae TaxID=2736640 RepID=A0A6M6JFJ0_9PSEU|nr:hypothetical protein [Pseudonocardia broussonetiae]QJY45149.1 hypothetical protein HOP40_04335 [Pseudonocardia broussonetiae]
MGAVAALGQVSQFIREQQWIDLFVGVAAVIVVAVVAAVVVLRVSGAGFSVSQISSGQLLSVSVTFSVLLVAGSLALAGWIGSSSTSEADSPVSPSSPGAGATTVDAAPSGTADGDGGAWAENFNEAALSPDRWEFDASIGLVDVASGQLVFRVTPELTPERFQTVTLAPIGLAGPYSSVSLSASIAQVTPSDGGVDLIVRQASGRESRLRMGPSENGPGVETWLCLRLPCGDQYDEFDHPGPAGFGQGVPGQLSIVQTGSQLELQAGDVRNRGPSDSSPIVDVQFLLETGSEENWSVNIDDLIIAR